MTHLEQLMCGLAALCCACPAAAMAEPAPAPAGAAAAPAAQPDQALAYLVGSWDVTATTPGTGETVRVDYDIRPLVGTWLTGRATSAEPGLEASDVWGRDLASGEIMRIILDGSGTYAVVRSPGWRGDTLVLEGDARSASGVVRVRETISRLDDNQFTATWEAYRNGVWSPYSLERVIRRPHSPKPDARGGGAASDRSSAK